MVSQKSISALVISDLDRFVRLKDFWDQQLRDQVDDPFFSSSMLIEHWKLSLRFHWKPFLMIFLFDGRIIGFAPLLMKSRFGYKQIGNYDQYTCPDFLIDEHRERCIGELVDYLFKRLQVETANITLMRGSLNQRAFEMVCRNRGLKLTRSSQEGQAIIPVNTSLDGFRKSLDGKICREFRRSSRKLDRLGPWKISCSEFNPCSLDRIWAVENHSWKMRLTGEKKAIKDGGLESVLRGVQRSRDSEWCFESKVWFLDLNEVPIAYLLVFRHNKTVFFAKTSFDFRFKQVGPGKVLMNDLIERIFKEKTCEKIDFYSNLPFVKVWRPLVKRRVTLNVKHDSLLSMFPRVLFENRVSERGLKILDSLKWKKKADYIFD